MTARGVVAVVGLEAAKLRAQPKTRALLAVIGASPFVFEAALRLQSAVPEDTLFGRGIKESGFATPLVMLGFAGVWLLPALASIVGGDLFSAEDRYRTWAMVLTRSRSRAELFAGKALTACGFSVLALTVLAVSSLAAGLLGVGIQPLIDLSGVELAPAAALGRVALAWASVVPPMLGFTAMAILLSMVWRSSVAGVALPVLAGLAMQLGASIDGPVALRRMLLTTGFETWRGLLVERPFYRPLVLGIVVSALYAAVCLIGAYQVFRRRDIGS